MENLEMKPRLDDLIEAKLQRSPSDRLMTSCRVWMDAGDIMSRDVATISFGEKLVSAAKQMSKDNISCIVVVDDHNVVGILTETDFLRKVAAKGKDFSKTKVSDIMSSPVVSTTPETSIFEASKITEHHRVKRLPILQNGKLSGIVTQSDLIRALMSYGLWRDVSDIMRTNVASVVKEASVADAAEVMTYRAISCVVIMDGKDVVGVFTERDLVKRVIAKKKNPATTKIKDVMTSSVMTVSPDYSVFTASTIMEKKAIRRLVVMEDDNLCGIVTQTDIFLAVKRKLQQEETKNHNLLEISETSIYTLDLQGILTYANPAFMKLLKVRDKNEIIDKPFLPESFWQDPQQRESFLEELRNWRNPALKELALKTFDDKNIYVTVFASVTKNIHGEINGSQGVLYDVTPKKELVLLKQTEEKLRQSKDRYTKAEEIGRFGHWDWDLTQKTAVLSKHAYHILGVATDDFEPTYKNFISHIHPEDVERFKNAFKNVISESEPFDIEYRLICPDGTERVVHSVAETHFNRNGSAVNLVGTIHDITERKLAEHQSDDMLSELKRFNKLAVGRELRMIELKREVNELLTELTREERYPITSVETCNTNN